MAGDLTNDEAVHALYESSKGIAAVVVTIFFLAQCRAIMSGKEDITKAMINSAVKDRQHFISRIFDTLREAQGQANAGRALSDLDSSQWNRPPAKRGNKNRWVSPALPLPTQPTTSMGEPHDTTSSAKGDLKSEREAHRVHHEPEDFRDLFGESLGQAHKGPPIMNNALSRPDEFH